MANAVNRWIWASLRTAVPASAATAAAVAVCGQAEEGNPIAPLNAVSHILWGDKAAQQDHASVEYTVTGIALNTAAITSWAAVYELAFGATARRGNVAAAILGGVSVATLAYLTDYYIVPKRLTPGFEKRLSPASMLAVYSALALSLPLASLTEAGADEIQEQHRRPASPRERELASNAGQEGCRHELCSDRSDATAPETFVMSTPSVDRSQIRQTSPRSELTSSSWWQILTTTYNEWSGDQGARLGAALAYYTIFSLAPMLVIVMAVAGLVFEPDQVQAALNGQFQSMLGEEGSEAVSALVAGAQQHEEGILATVLAIAALVFGAVGVFVQLKDALNTIWKVEQRSGRGWWQFVQDYFLSFTLVLGVGFLLIVMLVVNAVLSVVVGWFGELLAISAAAAYATELSVSFLIATLLFAMIFKFLPDARIAWRDVWLGAAVTSLLFNVGKLLIGLYLGQASFTSAYGAAGTVLIVLVWTYYSAQILFLGAEFTQVYARSYGDRIEPSDGAISTRRGSASVPTGVTPPKAIDDVG